MSLAFGHNPRHLGQQHNQPNSNKPTLRRGVGLAMILMPLYGLLRVGNPFTYQFKHACALWSDSE
jgi:hypothetical protein